MPQKTVSYFPLNHPQTPPLAWTASRLRRRRVRDLMSLLPLFLPANRKRSSFALGFGAPISPKPKATFLWGDGQLFIYASLFSTPPFRSPPNLWVVCGQLLESWTNGFLVGKWVVGFIWLGLKSSLVGEMKGAFLGGLSSGKRVCSKISKTRLA